MKEGNSGMLLTLGIGAAALFFLMKGKKPTEPDDMTLPELKQINPDPEESEEDTTDDAVPGGGQRVIPAVPAASGYRPYQPTATINTNPVVPVPYSPVNAQPVLQPAPVDKGLRFQADRFKRAAMPPAPAINTKSLRFQSGQARKLLASGALQRAKPVAMQRPLSTIISQVRNPVAIPTPVPQTTIFPLKFGQRNSYVKEIQSRIGVANTGYFGAQTREALQKRVGASEVSELLYKRIITGKPVVQRKTKPAIRRMRVVTNKGPLVLSKGIFKR